MKRSNYIILGIIIIIIGIATSIGGIIYQRNYKNMYKGYSEVVSAKVVDSIVKSENRNDKATGMSSNYYVYAPVIEYKVKGKTYRHESDIYDVTKPKVNDKINIKINNNNPKDIKFISKDYTTTILLIGVVIVVCGLGIIIINIKSPQKESLEEPIDTKKIIDKEEKEDTTEKLEVLEDEIEEDII